MEHSQFYAEARPPKAMLTGNGKHVTQNVPSLAEFVAHSSCEPHLGT